MCIALVRIPIEKILRTQVSMVSRLQGFQLAAPRTAVTHDDICMGLLNNVFL